MTFVLDATTRALKITIDAGAGADVQFVATYADSTSTTFTKGSSQGASNGSTAVDVVPAPVASTRRVVKAISFYNANATDPRTVTFYYDDNGTAYTIAKFTLQAGQSWYSETASTEEKGATILDATNRTIQFSIDTAGSDVQYTAAWADSTDTAFTQGSSRGLSNGTSAVTIVGAPAASTRRLVQSLTFYNAHASSTRVVTLFYDDNGTARTIAKFSLLAGESWFSEVATFGFQPAGSVLAAPAATAGPPSFRVLSLTDLATVTGSGSVVLQTTPTIITPRIDEIRAATTPFRAVLSFVQAANSANYLQLTNAATGAGLGPILETIGTGADINFEIKSKGTGNIVATTAGFNVKPLDSTVSGVLTILGGSGTAAGGQLVIRTNGTNEIGFRAPDSLAASVYYVLPAADGTNGQVLSTNGSGVLSWTAGGGAGVTDGDKGDITVSGSGATWTIDNTAVTLAKIQDITDQRLLGRAAGTSGTTQELTVSSILSLSGGALDFASQNAGLVLASPATTSGTPTFRALVATDIPSLTSIYQPLDADLTAIAALSADGLLRKSSGTWAMDSASYLTGNQTITLSGDVTGSGTTTISTTIANDAVTFAKMQNVTSGVLLGRTTASTGDVEEITPGTGVLTWLQTPTSTNLADAVTGETGTGALVFGTSPTLTTPRIAVIHTASSPNNAALGFAQVASSVNYVQITNSATGTDPIVEPVGTDSDIGLILRGKGSGFTAALTLQFNQGVSVGPLTTGAGYYGVISVQGGTTTGDGGRIALFEPGNNDYTGFVAPNSITASVLYALPGADGSNGQFLTTNGTGTLSWSNQTTTLSGDVTGSGTTAITTTIANNAVTTAKILNSNVTLAKIVDVAEYTLLGRDAATSGPLAAIQTSSAIIAWLKSPLSSNLFTAMSSKTGSGGNLVFATSPTLTTATLSGVTQLDGSGTAAAPLLTRTGDTNTGIFFPAADTIAISTGGVEGMRIDSTTNVGFGGTPDPFSRLSVIGTLPSVSGFGRAFRANVTIPSTISQNAVMYQVVGTTASVTPPATYTIPTIGQFVASNITLGTGCILTTHRGFWAEALTTGDTIQAFFAEVASGSNRWNFYAAGTANNYFKGRVGIDTTAPAVLLDVNDDSVRIRTDQTPASNAAGNAGEIAWDANYIYVCTAANTWKRVAITGGY